MQETRVPSLARKDPLEKEIATPWTVAFQDPLSMGFPRQEYWNGLVFPSLGTLPNPGMQPMSLMSPALQADSLSLSYKGSPSL